MDDILRVLGKINEQSTRERQKGAELQEMFSRTVRDREIDRVARERQEAAEKAARETK